MDKFGICKLDSIIGLILRIWVKTEIESDMYNKCKEVRENFITFFGTHALF